MYVYLSKILPTVIPGASDSAQLDNVLDANVEMEPGYPLPGRRIWIG